ncbi:methyl-accepting chemotaxis protein [Pseudaeromonas pectinilytica]
MKIRTLKQKILLSVGLALLSVILLLSALAYSTLRDQVIDGNYQQINQISERAALDMATWLSEKKQVIQTLSQQNEYRNTKSLLLSQEATGFASIYFAGTDGSMQDGDGSDYQGYDAKSQSWYQLAQGTNTPIIPPPYRDDTYTPPEIIISIAMARDDGVIGGDITTQRLQQILSAIKLPAQGVSILVDNQGRVIAYKEPERVLKPLSELIDGVAMQQLTQPTSNGIPLEVSVHGKAKLLWSRPVANSQWLLVSIVDQQRLFAPLQRQLIHQFLISGVILLVSIFSIGTLIGLLLRPLRRVSSALALIANGDGDLTQRLRVHTQDEVGQLAANFNQFVGSLHELIGHIRQEAESLGNSAASGLKRSADTVQELGNQQQEIAMVATAVTEMASATAEIAHNAENTAAAAQQSSVSSTDGLNLVNQTRSSITSLANEVGEATEVIHELSRHANEISSVLATIQGIAEQTNLLALNAAIEAARAGEQGRGFAVVADEVRVLSKRTQSSTTEIQSTIDTLQRTTQQAVALMEKSQSLASHSVEDAVAASRALDEITRAVSLISDMSTQIATAAEEQTKVTEEITANVTAIKEVGDELAEGAREEQQESRRLQEQAADLNEKVARFVL